MMLYMNDTLTSHRKIIHIVCYAYAPYVSMFMLLLCFHHNNYGNYTEFLINFRATTTNPPELLSYFIHVTLYGVVIFI